MNARRLLGCAVWLLLAVGAMPALAQEWQPPDPKAEPARDARLRLGPIFFNPTFRISDLGIDDNVFNDVEGNERQDLTGTLSMSSLVGVQARAFLLTAEQSNSYIWYRTYTSERSVDGSLKVVGQLRLGGIRPWAAWERVETHARGGFEIDARAGRDLPAWEVGTDIRLGWRMGVTGGYRKHEVKYAEGEFFDGVDLREALDHTSEDIRGYGRLLLTDVNDFVAGVERRKVRFRFSPIRDSDDYFYFAGFESAAEARIGLNLKVGWQEQRHVDPTVPGFKGVVGSGGVGFIVKDFMKVDVGGRRTINRSYEERFPYYLQEGGDVRSHIRFSQYFDIILDGRLDYLKYDTTVTGESVDRRDRTMVLGGEFGYFFGGADGTRVGIRYEYATRRSPVDIKNYARSRFYSSFRLNF
jgi:hypothetical protein